MVSLSKKSLLKTYSFHISNSISLRSQDISKYLSLLFLSMDFQLKQWRNQKESEQQYSSKMPKFLPEPHQLPQSPHSPASTLPLFVSEPNSKVSSMSALSDSTLAATTTYPRMGSYFSFAQWQELELQALIFRYMLVGAAVPPELLQPIKKRILHSTPYFLNHPLQNYHPPCNFLTSKFSSTL